MSIRFKLKMINNFSFKNNIIIKTRILNVLYNIKYDFFFNIIIIIIIHSSLTS